MPQAKSKSEITEEQKERFKDLEARFYKKLKESGFIDIEDSSLPDRPLKEWHNNRFASDEALSKIAIREEYQKLIDHLSNHKDFDKICHPSPNRWNKLSQDNIKEIWRLWGQEGWTERKIANHMKVSKTTIHHFLEKLRKWMMLL